MYSGGVAEIGATLPMSLNCLMIAYVVSRSYMKRRELTDISSLVEEQISGIDTPKAVSRLSRCIDLLSGNHIGDEKTIMEIIQDSMTLNTYGHLFMDYAQKMIRPNNELKSDLEVQVEYKNRFVPTYVIATKKFTAIKFIKRDDGTLLYEIPWSSIQNILQAELIKDTNTTSLPDTNSYSEAVFSLQNSSLRVQFSSKNQRNLFISLYYILSFELNTKLFLEENKLLKDNFYSDLNTFLKEDANKSLYNTSENNIVRSSTKLSKRTSSQNTTKDSAYKKNKSFDTRLSSKIGVFPKNKVFPTKKSFNHHNNVKRSHIIYNENILQDNQDERYRVPVRTSAKTKTMPIIVDLKNFLATKFDNV